MSKCPFRFALGVPGEGVHALRLFGLAVNDTLMTIIAAIFTSYAFNINLGISLLVWFIAGEILHYGYGVNTAFLKMIGIERNCD